MSRRPKSAPRTRSVETAHEARKLDDGRKIAEPITVGFAERDDSRTKSHKEGTLLEDINIHWTGVPTARMKAKFAKRDYCGKVANGMASSAPHWLHDRTDD